MIRAHNPNPSASDKSLCGDYHLGMTPGAAVTSVRVKRRATGRNFHLLMSF
jgi:hypothetical protein